ncbi:hypothetical protein HK102_001763 [Quaeritorhiza haematococci]|nr:hypothetical protein HK102_001763 [Quaeritorhiza haematococci]
METYEKQRVELQVQLKSLQQELGLQKDTSTEKIEALKREHELDVQRVRQECEQQLLSVKQNMVSTEAELNAIRLAKGAMEQKVQDQVEVTKATEKRLLEVQWELSDTTKMMGSRIAELEEMLRQSRAQAADDVAALEEQRKSMVHQSEQKEKIFQHEKSLLEEQVSHLTHRLAAAIEYSDKVKMDGQQQLREAEETRHADVEQIDALRLEILKGKDAFEEAERRYKNEIAQKHTQIAGLHESIGMLKTDLQRQHMANLHLSSEIKKHIDAQQDLQKSLLETNLMWERRLEEAHRKKWRNQDEVLKAVLAAKEKAEAQVKFLQNRLQRKKLISVSALFSFGTKNIQKSSKKYHQEQPTRESGSRAASKTWESSASLPSLTEEQKALIQVAENFETAESQGNPIWGGTSAVDTKDHLRKSNTAGISGASDSHNGYAFGVEQFAVFDEEKSILQARLREMQDQNEHLTEIIHRMREDMEAVQQGLASFTPKTTGLGLNKTNDFGRPTGGDNDELERFHGQLNRLQKLLSQKQGIIDELLDQQERLHTDMNRRFGGREDRRSVGRDSTRVLGSSNARGEAHQNEDERGNNITTANVQDGSSPLHPTSQQQLLWQHLVSVLQPENMLLKQKLREAVEELKRITGEKNKFVDMSNCLRAELRRFQEGQMGAVAVGTQTDDLVTSHAGPQRNPRKEPPPRYFVAAPAPPGPQQLKTQTQRTTASQHAAKARLAAQQSSPTRISRVNDLECLDPSSEEKYKKLELRARGIRNWNEKDD